MSRSIALLALAAMLALSASFALAQAPPPPSTRSFSDADYVKAQAEAAAAPSEPASSFELPAGGDESAVLSNGDEDTAHYGRGRTLVIHIFINHTGGTWTAEEMNGAGARARVAKDHFINNAPWNANVSFDYDGSNAYWYYNPTVNYNIPDSGMNNTVVQDALANIGIGDGDGDGTRVDDLTFFLQNWGGGWDNVLACFEPDQTGRAWASYSYAMTYLYTNSSGNVFAHEWGHLFGACDEYVEGGQCNGGINCGACQSTYLDAVVNNGNCQLASCPSDVACLMIDNTFNGICDYTRRHWGWRDGDGNGQLDTLKRRLSGNTFVNIWELFHNGWFYWNYTGEGMVAPQYWHNWAVTALRSPSGADYDLRVYGDNNHHFQYASSAYGGTTVDFVVGDYNHSPIGNEHIEVYRYSGNDEWYNLTYESGGEMLFADGIARYGSWNDYSIAQVWDVPLFGGETLSFYLTPSAGLDMGMALYKSNGEPYWTGRSGAVAVADAYGPGGLEAFSFTVPVDDVYGLVLWSNAGVAGTFSIQIGPSPVLLAEESPFSSALDLRLYDYDPNSIYWAFVGTRPDAGTDVKIGLYDDAQYQTLFNEVDSFGAGWMEFFAADYNDGYSRDHLRVQRLYGGTHTSEWEQDPEVLSGATSGLSWGSTHLGKVWDSYLVAGQPYFFREYHPIGSGFDSGAYLFSSADGYRFKSRAQWESGSDWRPASDGGEWFSYTPWINDWYGYYLIANNQYNENYSIWMGPQEAMPEDFVETRSEEILWGSADVSSVYWTVFAARPAPGEAASVWLYGDPGYTITTLAASDQTANPVVYVVGDYNHNSVGTVYPRFRRSSGYQNIDCEWEGGSEQLVFIPGTIQTLDLAWGSDVAEIWDIYLSAGQQVRFDVEDLSGAMDFGLAFFASNGGAYYANRDYAVAESDANGAGGSESVTITAGANDWYGVLVYNKNDASGDYRIHVIDPASASAEETASAQFGLQPIGANPFTDQAGLAFELPSAATTRLAVYDVHGREIRSLVDSQASAGHHTVTWDGRDASGAIVPSGIYFARLESGGRQMKVKLVRSR